MRKIRTKNCEQCGRPIADKYRYCINHKWRLGFEIKLKQTDEQKSLVSYRDLQFKDN